MKENIGFKDSVKIEVEEAHSPPHPTTSMIKILGKEEVTIQETGSTGAPQVVETQFNQESQK